MKTIEKIKDLEKDLPEMLKKVIKPFETTEEQLMVLTATIAQTGALMPQVWFNYDGKKNYPMLMVMFVAPPASGKGVLSYPKRLLSLIDAELRKKREEIMSHYQEEIKRIKSENKKKSTSKLPLPQLPQAPLLFVPGNVTQAALIQQLNANGSDNPIIIFEQEADTYSLMVRKGDYSVGNSTILRSLFHFERVSQLRKTDNEYLFAENPKGVVIFSGTTNQVSTIFNSNQDGLFSRFLFITIDGTPIFRNVFKKNKKSNEDYFDELAPKFYQTWKYFRNRDIEVTFTDSQEKLIIAFGERYFAQTHNFFPECADSLPKRHANMLTRIAVILRMLRYYEDKETGYNITCRDEDIAIALWIAELSIENALQIFKKLPGEKVSKDNIKKNELWEKLPLQFKTNEIKPLLEELEIADRSFYRWLRDFVETGLLEKIIKGEYRKTPMA